MRILGISAFHRDSAAALVVDGEPVAAIQEERLTRLRGDASFPLRASRWCLTHAGLHARDLDRIVFYEKPLRKFERVLASLVGGFPHTSRSFARGMFLWLGDRLWMRNRIASELEVDPARIAFTEHHRAHAASAFLPAPCDEAAILVVDGSGEWATTSLGVGRGHEIAIEREVHFPHSLGLLRSALTQFLGFEPGYDEGKVTALAALGEPTLRSEVERLVPARPDQSFEVSTAHFRFAHDADRLFDDRLEELLGPARRPGAPLRATRDDRRDADLAASLQAVLEERVLALASAAHARTPLPDLCLAGEVALDRAAVTRLAADGPFERVYVPPDPTDAGAALGAALEAAARLGDELACGPERVGFLGEAPADALEDGARLLASNDDVLAGIAQRLGEGRVVGWVRGRLELAPTSLGHRSLLADPLHAGARARLRDEVRRDEAFLPFPLAAPADRLSEWFDVPAGLDWPLRYGHATVRVRSDALRPAASPDGRVPLLAVDPGLDPDFAGLLERCEQRGGLPVLVHAALAARGAPLARGEHDAVDLWRRTAIDALVVDRRLYE